jgi:hypothetical protein
MKPNVIEIKKEIVPGRPKASKRLSLDFEEWMMDFSLTVGKTAARITQLTQAA